MSLQAADRHEEIGQILDRLGATPQQLLDHKHSVARQSAFINVDEAVWTVTKPSKAWLPFAFLWKLNLEKLNRDLRATLDALGIGYCYMIKRKGKIVHLGASGWAQLPDDGDIRWLFHVAMNIASVSKFITAIATVRLLRDLNIPVTTPIQGYLPQYWTFGPGVGAITFADLMRHESGLGGTLNPPGGFDPGPVTFETAKEEVERGSTGRGAGTSDYKNLNFTLLRIMFATLTGAVSPGFSFAQLPFFGALFADVVDNDFWDFASFTAYSNYVNDVVFTTAGITARGFDFPEVAAKAYATPAAVPGWIDGDTSAGAGTSGWYLSIGDLMWVLGEFRRGGAIMGTKRARNMLARLYGIDEAIATNAGPVYRKNGRWGAGSQVHDSAIYLMPGDAELAIFVNSVPAGMPPVPSYLNPIGQLIVDSAEIDFGFSLNP
jgi:CubicO group peptidase (beta-lactamase class C family)